MSAANHWKPLGNGKLLKIIRKQQLETGTHENKKLGLRGID